MLKNAIKMNLDDLWAFLAVEGGAFLLWEIVEAIIMYAVKPDTSAAIGGIILFAVAVMMNLFIGCAYPTVNVDMLLRFGATRRIAMAATLGTLTLNTAVSMALAALLGWVDVRIANAWLNALPWVTEAEFMTINPPAWSYFAIGLGVVCLAFGMGSLLQRFGRKAFWIGWAAWMALIVGMNIIDLDAVIESPAAIPALVVLCVISLLGGGVLTMRTSVKN